MQLTQAVSRFFKPAFFIAAGGLLTAASMMGAARAHAAEPKPAARSTLVSSPDLQFEIAETQQGASQVVRLLHRPVSGEPFAVAEMVSAKPEGVVSIRRLPLPPGDAKLEVATLEHLYVFAIAQEPLGSYCLAAVARACDESKGRLSHAQLLRELVEARNGAVRKQNPAGRPVPWRVISMAPAATDSRDADQVAVRVSTGREPLQGANVYFNRAPHSGCAAKSDAKGLAACRLVDQHGEDAEEDESRVPVVATFSGDVRADRVLVPSTFVVRNGPADPLAKATR
jgi:hypothetical protein